MIRKARAILVRSLVATSLVVSMLGASVATAADNSTPQAAAPLAGSTSGALAGANGGNFAYYKFNYPGDQRRATISLTAAPNDQAILQYVGFKVYGPDPGREYASANASKDATPSATADLITSQAGEYVVQVYNYVPNPEAVISFTLSVSGLPQAAPPTPVAAPAVAAPAPISAPAASTAQPVGDPTSPERAPRLAGNVTGQLAGANGGNFHFYKFNHTGDNSTVTLGLTVTPNDPIVLQYVGFKLYGPDAGREYAAANSQKDASPNAQASVALNQAGEYVVQVYNYVPNPETVIAYTLSASGLPPQPNAPAAVPAPAPAAPAPAPAPAAAPASAPAAPSGDNSTPQGAHALRGTASGAIAGANGGNFRYYKFSYAGDGRTVTINLTVTPNDPVVLQYVGFKLYGPDAGREYASANAQKDANPSASATLSNNQAGEYVIQVYNYVANPETVVNFTLSATGT